MAEQFKPKDMVLFRKVFDSFDEDGNGSIDKRELRSALTRLKMYDALNKIDDTIEKVDRNNDKKISWDEFVKCMVLFKFGDKKGLQKPKPIGGKRQSVLGKAFSKESKNIDMKTRSGGKHSFSTEEMAAFTEHFNGVLGNDKTLGYLLPMDSKDIDKLDLCRKIHDGVMLAKFINKAVPDTIDERALNRPRGKKALSRFQVCENMNLVINSAKGIGIKVTNIGASELMDGPKHPHLVLGIVWQLVKLQLLNSINLKQHPELMRLLEDGEDLEDLLRLPPEQLLLRWFNYHLKNAGTKKRVRNFSSDVKDSQAYTILLHQIAPGTCDDKALQEKSKKKSAAMVLANAKKLDVEAFITPHDICAGNPRLNLAFTAAIFNQCPGLDPLEEEELEKIGLDEDDEGSREERAFRMWMNSLGIEDLHINNLYEDCADGVKLLKVIDAVKPGIVYWKNVYKKPSNKFKKLANNNYAVVLGKQMKFSLVGISGDNFVNKNKKLLLAFVWQLMRYHTIEYLKKVQAKKFGGKDVTDEMMIKWANSKVKKAGKSSRMRSFRDKNLHTGVFFLDLLDAINHQVLDEQYITEGSTQEDALLNAKYAISVARKLGAVVFLIPEDIVDVKAKMILTFVASLMSLD